MTSFLTLCQGGVAKVAQLNTIGERIAYLRMKNKLTQKEVMQLLDFNNLSRYENNERTPSVNVIITLAEYFNVSTDWILLGRSNTDKCCSNDKNLERIIELFTQLNDLEKGIVIGRIEAMIDDKNHPPKKKNS